MFVQHRSLPMDVITPSYDFRVRSTMATHPCQTRSIEPVEQLELLTCNSFPTTDKSSAVYVALASKLLILLNALLI